MVYIATEVPTASGLLTEWIDGRFCLCQFGPGEAAVFLDRGDRLAGADKLNHPYQRGTVSADRHRHHIIVDRVPRAECSRLPVSNRAGDRHRRPDPFPARAPRNQYGDDHRVQR